MVEDGAERGPIWAVDSEHGWALRRWDGDRWSGWLLTGGCGPRPTVQVQVSQRDVRWSRALVVAAVVGTYFAIAIGNRAAFGYWFWTEGPPSTAADRALTASLVLLAAVAGLGALVASAWRRLQSISSPIRRLAEAARLALRTSVSTLVGVPLSVLSVAHGLGLAWRRRRREVEAGSRPPLSQRDRWKVAGTCAAAPGAFLLDVIANGAGPAARDVRRTAPGVAVALLGLSWLVLTFAGIHHQATQEATIDRLRRPR